MRFLTMLVTFAPVAPRLALEMSGSVVDGLVRGVTTRFVNLRRSETYPRFRPVWWARDGISQTVMPILKDCVDCVEPFRGWEPRYVVLEDGVLCRLDVAACRGGPAAPACRGVIVVLHGLAGSSDAPYCKNVAREFCADYAVVVINRRSHVAESLGARAPTHYDRGDLELVLAHLRRTLAGDGRLPLYAFGVSGGANQLMRYAGDAGARCVFRRAMACGNGWDYDLATANMGSRALDHALCRMNERVYGNVVGGRKFFGHSRFRDQEAAVNGGHDALPAYYAGVSAIDVIDRVAIPVLCMDALDDPIYVYPRMGALFGRNPNLSFVITSHGGHVGWLDAEGAYYVRVLRRWLDDDDGGDGKIGGERPASEGSTRHPIPPVGVDE